MISADVKNFAVRYQNRVATLDADGLAAACRECERFLGPYLSLSVQADVLAADGRDPQRADALFVRCDDLGATVVEHAGFFEEEVLGLEDSHVERLLADPGMAGYAHYVRRIRAGAAHRLPGSAGEVLARLEPVGAGAWERMARQLLGRVRVPGEAGPIGLGEALPVLYDAETGTRRQRCAAISDALAADVDLRAAVLLALSRYRAVEGRLRGVSDWSWDQRIDQQLSGADVEALLGAVRGRRQIVHRYYRVKEQLLGQPLTDADRYAPLGPSWTRVEWTEAVDLVLRAFAVLGGEFVGTARRLIEDGAVDAAPRPGKQRGAKTYSAPGGRAHVLVNFTGRLRDVLTLGHELAHGVHTRLTTHLGPLTASPPTCVAEAVGLFAETLVAESLLSQVHTPQERLAVSGRIIEDRLVAVFRQAAMQEFEDGIHTAAWQDRDLDAAAVSRLWMAGQQDLYGEAVTLTPGYRHWWSYLDTFFLTPGRLPAYVFGQLAALTLHNRFREDPAGFTPRYRAMLAAGATRAPAELFATVGIHPGAAESWQAGLDSLAADVEALTLFRPRTEQASRVVGQDMHAGNPTSLQGGDSL